MESAGIIACSQAAIRLPGYGIYLFFARMSAASKQHQSQEEKIDPLDRKHSADSTALTVTDLPAAVTSIKRLSVSPNATSCNRPMESRLCFALNSFRNLAAGSALCVPTIQVRPSGSTRVTQPSLQNMSITGLVHV